MQLGATPHGYVRPIRLLDEAPELGADLDAEQFASAREKLRVLAMDCPSGPWAIYRHPFRKGDLGFLVLDGLATRDVHVHGSYATELIGPGDLLRPSDDESVDGPVPLSVNWRVLESTRVALLDVRFTAQAARWPYIVAQLCRTGVRRTESIATLQALSHLRGLEARLMVLLWSLADRFGHVERDGVAVPLRLTHELLGTLVGARRAPVTHALGRLREQGRVVRRSDGGWLLRGDPAELVVGARAGHR